MLSQRLISSSFPTISVLFCTHDFQPDQPARFAPFHRKQVQDLPKIDSRFLPDQCGNLLLTYSSPPSGKNHWRSDHNHSIPAVSRAASLVLQKASGEPLINRTALDSIFRSSTLIAGDCRIVIHPLQVGMGNRFPAVLELLHHPSATFGKAGITDLPLIHQHLSGWSHLPP